MTDAPPSSALPARSHVLILLRRRASEALHAVARLRRDDPAYLSAKDVADAAADEPALLERTPTAGDPLQADIDAIVARVHDTVLRFRAGSDDAETRKTVERLPAAWRIDAMRCDPVLRERLATLPRRPLTIDDYVECWWVPGETHIVDLIHPETGLTLHYGHGADEVTARHPTAIRIDCEDAWRRIDDAAKALYIRDIAEIDEATFMDALNILPPVGWREVRGVESFKISERITGNITDIYARLGTRFFKLTDDIRLPAEEIAQRVAAFAAEHPAPERRAGDPSLSEPEAPKPRPGGGT